MFVVQKKLLCKFTDSEREERSPATKRTVRMDTGEVVSDVAMSEVELQENLFRPGELEQMYEGGQPPEPPKAEGDQPGAES